LEAADVVIASTGADNPIISKPMVSDIMKHRKGRPIFFIDIAVPRDVEPGVAEIEGVFAYDIDDLQEQVEVDAHSRETEIAKVEAIIQQEVAGFAERLRSDDSSDKIGIWNNSHSAAGHNRAEDGSSGRRYRTAGELP
jgi:glutamyl-tRNA reductase